MPDNDKFENSSINAEDHSIAIGGINVGGNVGDIRIGHGLSAEEVSVLLTQITSTFQPKPFDGRCPYKGLDVFEEDDAELFFGRERLVEDLVGRVKESRTVFVTGPSGSGKSSLVRAGLVPALKQGTIKSSEHWLYETMKPGREPLKDLALAFSRLKSPELEDYFLAHAGETDILNKCAESVLSGRKDQRFVLFIDQFEEVFTQINNEEERQAFLNMLAHAGTVENGRVIILFAMRSDFVSNCATYPALNEMLSQQFRQIGAMQPEELVSAIALPAKEVGLPIEDELIARIINDMKGEPGALPLMQFALKDLFDSQQEQGGVIALTLKDYLNHGGIHKSLERHADKSFTQLSENEQELARSIFSGLIEIGRGTQDTKRTALFDELIPANTRAEDVLVIVQKLADARLIITDEQAGKDTVTISHEKLIEAWPWLKKLVNENREVIALQNEIAADAKEWEDRKRDASYLYTGGRLANVREQLEKQKLALSHLAQEFVRAGRARQRRAQAFLISVVSVVLIIAIVASVVFQTQAKANFEIANTAQSASTFAVAQQATAQANAEEAQQQAKIARAGELVAQSIETRVSNFELSLLLGIEAFHAFSTERSRENLLEVLNYYPQLFHYLLSPTGLSVLTTSLVFSSDGTTLFAGSCELAVNGKCSDGKIILWDTATGIRTEIPMPLGALPTSIAISSDGKTLAYGIDSSVNLLDVEARKIIGEPIAAGIYIDNIVFSPNNKILVICGDQSVILWDLETSQLVGQPLPGQYVIFSPEGTILATEGDYDKIVLYDAKTREPIGLPFTGQRRLTAHAIGSVVYNSADVAISSDGKTLAYTTLEDTIVFWDIASHEQIGQPIILTDSDQSNNLRSVVFSPDGQIFASSTEDGTISLWDTASHQRIRQLDQGLNIWGADRLTFSPNGRILAVGSFFNGPIVLWYTQGPQHLQIKERLPLDQVDPKYLAILSTASSHDRIAFPGLAFTQDGKTMAASSTDSTIILWNVETRQPIGQPLSGHSSFVTHLVFSPDGKTLASSGCANFESNTCRQDEIIMWDVATGQSIGIPLSGHSSVVTSLAFSPDGKILASGYNDNTIVLWDVSTHQVIGQLLKANSRIQALAYSPDGKTLASGGSDLTLWNLETYQSVSLPSEDVISIAFSADGKTLASEQSAKISLWDVATHHLIGQGLPLPIDEITDNYVFRLAFSADGKTLTSVRDETVITWDLDPDSWVEKTCQRAGRNFTREEWTQYFPNENYRATCSDLTPSLVPSSPLSPVPLATVDTSRLININTASFEDLIMLPAIGLKTAQGIISFREQYGLFISTENIIGIADITPTMYERIKNLITVGP